MIICEYNYRFNAIIYIFMSHFVFNSGITVKTKLYKSASFIFKSRNGSLTTDLCLWTKGKRIVIL